jgi:metal-responsive CopG/Arc/MetJ family transcriptional regulator
MTTLSIVLPDFLAKASRSAAKQLGVSRTQFIRLAIAHEIENITQKTHQNEIIKSFSMMKKTKSYLKEAEKIDQNFGLDMPIDGDNWWTKK